MGCKALIFKPNLEMTSDNVTGFRVQDFAVNNDLLGSLTSLSESFREFVEGHWDNLITAAGIKLFSLCGFHTHSGGRKSEALTRCGQERITIGAFWTDGGGG
jgi:hypothetical protein